MSKWFTSDTASTDYIDWNAPAVPSIPYNWGTPVVYTDFSNTTTLTFKLPNSAEDIEMMDMSQTKRQGEITFLNYKSYFMLVFYRRDKKGYEEGPSASPGYVSYFNIKDLLSKFFLTVHYRMERINNWRSRCIGVSSCATRNYGPDSEPLHVPLFDYDGADVKRKIRRDVRALQKEFNLGDAWVYKTKRGYHVYFFYDEVSWDDYCKMLDQVKCCPGFRQMSKKNRFAVLRVSAKYSEFDIKLEYVLPNKSIGHKRMSRFGHVVQEFLRLGSECNTHFASLFPQWANFREDRREWKPSEVARRKGKRIRKVKAILEPPADLFVNKEGDLHSFDQVMLNMEKKLYGNVDLSVKLNATKALKNKTDEDIDF